jgi:hypothetical protein
MNQMVDDVLSGTMTMEEAFARMGHGAELAYAGLAKGASTTMWALSKYVADNLVYQGKAHWQLADVGKSAALSMAGGIIEAQSKTWANLAKGYALQAAAFAIIGDWGGAGSLAATAAGLAALAGVSAGVATYLEGEARQTNIRDIGAPPTYSDTGAYDTSRGQGSAGSRMVAAGAVPQTVNFNFAVYYQGPVIFGNGGTRDWYEDQLKPMIQESLNTGALRTAVL